MIDNTTRTLILSAFLLVLAYPAEGQQGIRTHRLLGPVKDAGIYHVGSGTWTRTTGQSANLGPDIIYRNDVPSGYLGVGWEGATGVDEGIIPTTANPVGGLQDAYEINGLSFAYCALGSGPNIQWDLTLFDSYVPCDDPDIPANCIHEAWFGSFPGFPANNSCWLVTLDLSGGNEVCLAGDGGPCAPGYQGGALNLDHFGFGQRWQNGGLTAGPILSGDPIWAPRGEGTCYNPTLTCPQGATGLGMLHRFGIGTPLNGCFWFGSPPSGKGCGSPGGPYAQMNLTLFTDCTQACVPEFCPSTTFCGDGLASPNFTDIHIDTCDCSAGSIRVSLSKGPPGVPGYLLVSESTGLLVNPPGAQGSLCLGSPIGRFAKDVGLIDTAGILSTDILNANSGGGGGNVPTLGKNFCNPGGGTWTFQYWHRMPAGAPAAFSNALQAVIR